MSVCSLCGAILQCGQLDPDAKQPCWCVALPPAVPVPGSAAVGCWCPACLQERIAALTSPAAKPLR
ncbi:cysteine-rich CWC family protein [Janthinobacterium sp. UMAB-56]|uniref:cysteine-rich CWC family protein n=1 Tax=Janthinobacterium sp. UMAB-56 TaxID=1365361 RepID=UPI001C5A1748|nr:cysteine-rich CWC family protein [Janthinobacterium sp. UMAB-56]